jgi:hypothetical protein
MTVILLFLGFVFCVAGVVRGTARVGSWSFRSAISSTLFWASLIGCLATIAMVVAGILMAATFDERKNTDAAYILVWGVSFAVMRIASVASLVLHLLLSLTPVHAPPTKPTVA